MRKDALLAFLMNQTDFFDPENVSEVFTARYLAQRFNMQRNTASHYLNQLVAQGACSAKSTLVPSISCISRHLVSNFLRFRAMNTLASRNC